MSNLFMRKNNNENTDNPFQNWISFDVLSKEDIMPGVLQQTTPDLIKKSPEINEANIIPSAIVIGLGKSGATILCEWMKHIDENDLPLHNLRTYWIYCNEIKQPELFPDTIRQRQVNLYSDGVSQRNGYSSRERMHAYINQALVYDRIKEYLIQDALDLNGRIRIFITASIREPIAGIVGDILQLLGILRNDRALNFNITVSCLLTLDGPEEVSTLGDVEIFTIVREISRLTFKGIHVMPAAISEQSGVLYQEVLEYFFLVDDTEQNLDNESISFSSGSAQIAAEAIFVLTNSVGEKIWGDLINRLTDGVNIQKTLQTPLIYGLTSASLFLPVTLLENYAVSRLIKAVFYGEKNGVGEGLVIGNGKKNDIEQIFTGWLKEKPDEHPFFSWLLKARHNCQPLPKFISGESAVQAFTQRICNQLNIYLNSPDGDLENASLAIEALIVLHNEIVLQLDQLAEKKFRKVLPNELSLREYLTGARNVLNHIKEELNAWIVIFRLNHEKNTESEKIALSSQNNNPFETINWGNQQDNPFEIQRNKYMEDSINPFGVSTYENTMILGTETKGNFDFVMPVFDEKIKQAYQALLAASDEPISRSIIQKTAGNDEIEALYRNVVRPELNNINAQSSYFYPIRSRLGWWVRIDGINGIPRVYAVALPAGNNLENDQKLKAIFPVQRAYDFYCRVLSLCQEEIRSLKQRFNTQIFVRDAFERKDFLRRAGNKCIRYDAQLIAGDRLRSPEVAQSFGYLLYKPLEIEQKQSFREYVFDGGVERTNVKDIHWNQNRVVALQIMTNLPVWRIELFNRIKGKYRNTPLSRHLYSPEINAFDYERRANDEFGEEILFTPRTCMVLAERELVHLFFKAYLAKLIIPMPRNNGLQARDEWTVTGVLNPDTKTGEIYPPVFLDAFNTTRAVGLWGAMESFALKLPNRLSHEISPTDTFYLEGRTRFINALRTTIRTRKESVDPEWQKEIRTKILPELDVDSRENPLAKDLACLLRIEIRSIL